MGLTLLLTKTRFGTLVRAATQDVSQVVILGAGFDCRAYRLEALRGARVFEIDHPATQAVKRAQQRLLLVHGADLADLRMYDSLGAIVRGWRKNFFVVLQRALPLAPLCALLCAWAFAGVPLGALGLALYALSLASGKVALCAAGAAFADLLARLALRQGYRVTARGSRALGGVMVAWILCSSAFRAATGRAVTWRGRSLIPS